MRSLLVLLAAVRCLAQAPTLSLDLSGEWRWREEDRPEFARADFDDHPWDTKRLPLENRPDDLKQSPDPRPVGVWWLRRTVDLPEWASTSGLALTLGGMNEVYEVFVNGQRIGSVGGPRLSESYIARPHTFLLPTLPSRRLTIAVRHWRPEFATSAVRGLGAFPDAGPYLLTSRANIPRDAAAAQMALRERRATPLLLVAEFAAVLAVLLLFGWFLQRDRKDLALLAGVLLSQAWLKGYDYVSVVADWPHWTNLVGAMGLTATPVFLARFTEAVLGLESRWLSRAAWALFGIHLLQNIVVGAADGTHGRTFAFLWITLSMAIVLLFIFLVAGRAAGRFAQQGKWATAVIPFSIAIIAFLLSQAASSPLRILRTAYDHYGMRWQLVDALTVAAGFAMTIQLLRGWGAARQRLASEMEAARAVQQLLLDGGPAKPESPYRIETAYLPAQEVGGDFYKILDGPDGSQVVVVGDVSGKGLPAAMLVSAVMGALGRETSSSPGAILAGLNQAIAGQTRGGFITCCALRLAREGITIANAGHLPPYRDGQELALEPGLPLGMVPDVTYPEAVFPPGGLTLVTDGVVEAENRQRELFGFDRTRAISTQAAQEIAEAAKQWGQNDDITVVTVRRDA